MLPAPSLASVMTQPRVVCLVRTHGRFRRFRPGRGSSRGWGVVREIDQAALIGMELIAMPSARARMSPMTAPVSGA